jgi:hypothetical protein
MGGTCPLNCHETSPVDQLSFPLQNALSVFEVNGRKHSIVGVLALGVIKHLDIFEDVLPCDLIRSVGFPPDLLALQQLEKALGNSIIMTVAAAAHAGFQIVLTQESLPLAAGILRTLIGMSVTVPLGLRRQTAISKACKAKSVVMGDCIDQPTTRSENRSMTTARVRTH